MLQFKQFTLTHTKDLQDLIKDLSLTINPSDKLAIIGEEGTGKSSLIKAIADPETLASYAQQKGDLINQFQSIAYLPQGLSEQALNQEVWEFLESDRDYQLFDVQVFYQLLGQLDCHFLEEENSTRTVRDLSGGERLKLQLLKILSQQPDLLILDEPTSDLDLETITWLENFLARATQTLILISHDEGFLEQTATTILHLELLKKRQEARWTYFKGDYTTYKEERKARFDHQLQVAQKEREDYAKRLEKNNRIQSSVQHQLRQTKDATAGRLLAKKMKNILSQEKRYEKEAERFTEIPQDMEAIQVFFSGVEPLAHKKSLLHWEEKTIPSGQKISLQIYGQDKLVITGKNGVGKTRLLKEILYELAKKPDISIAYMPQNYEDVLNQTTSALDFLRETTDTEKARNILASLKFTREEIQHSTDMLSGGQKAKLFFAKMILDGSQVLILDEPSRHFSPTSQPLIRQLLKDFPGAIISVSHDRKYIQEVPKLIYHLDDTKLTLEKKLD